MFTADLMSAHSMNDPSRSGFTSKEAAWDYVRTRLCKTCTQDLKDGTEDHPSDTMCGAEWEVTTTDPTENAIPINATNPPTRVTLDGTEYQADATGHWPELTAQLVQLTQGEKHQLTSEEENTILHASNDSIRKIIRFISMHYPETGVLTHE